MKEVNEIKLSSERQTMENEELLIYERIIAEFDAFTLEEHEKQLRELDLVKEKNLNIRNQLKQMEESIPKADAEIFEVIRQIQEIQKEFANYDALVAKV